MRQPDKSTTDSDPSFKRRLKWKLRLSGWALTSERAFNAFWPVLVLALLTLSGLIWQVHRLLPYPLDLLLYLALLGAMLVYIVRGRRVFRPANRRGAIARLDTSVQGSPVAAMHDEQAMGSADPQSKELWELHQAQMKTAAAKVEVRPPKIRLARRDPWALRLIVAVIFAVTVLFGRNYSENSLMETLQDLASGTAGVTVSYEAWAEPPAYTGHPSIYLNEFDPAKTLELPHGTQLVFRSYGTGALGLKNGVTTPDSQEGRLETELSITVNNSGHVALSKGFRRLVEWDISVIPDTTPHVELVGEIARTLQGSIQIPFKATDDYGIVGEQVEITLDLSKVDRRHGLVLAPETMEPIRFDVPLPFNADAADFSQTIVEDLAEHPWAGLPVKIILNVQDAAGNVGVIDPVYRAMPGKRFFDSLAGAIVEQRRDILWNRGNADRVAMILRTLSHRPETGFDHARAYLMVRSVIRRLDYNPARPISDDIQNDIGDTLWRAALLIEDGDLSNAAERLSRAQERLSEAMKNGATQDEIAELMEELRRATDEYLKQLAQKAKPKNQQADAQNRKEISQNQLQEMMNRIQDLMEQGRMDEAQQLLDQLQQMMENMQITQGQGQGDQDGSEGVEGLQDTLRQQQDLADENFQKMQDEFRRNQEGGSPQTDSEPDAQNGQGGGGLAQRQEALRDMLEQQLEGLGQDQSEAGQAAREALREAETRMGAAGDDLGRGDRSGALDNQADAVEALRQGMQNLSEARRQAGTAGDTQENGNGQGAGDMGQDPLGRARGQAGSGESTDGMVPSAEQLRRSNEILEEIRKRSGQRGRPQFELDYLERLLDRF